MGGSISTAIVSAFAPAGPDPARRARESGSDRPALEWQGGAAAPRPCGVAGPHGRGETGRGRHHNPHRRRELVITIGADARRSAQQALAQPARRDLDGREAESSAADRTATRAHRASQETGAGCAACRARGIGFAPGGVRGPRSGVSAPCLATDQFGKLPCSQGVAAFMRDYA